MKKQSTIKTLNQLGFHAYRFLWVGKIMAFYYSRVEMCVYWVLKEPDCILLLNVDGVDRFNKVSKVKKIRDRDLNRISVFRTPKKTWGKLKAAK